MMAGLAVAFGALLAIASGLVVAARRVVRPAWPYLLRQGISNLHRPHNQTLLFLLSLGLGSFLLLTILFTRNLLPSGSRSRSSRRARISTSSMCSPINSTA